MIKANFASFDWLGTGLEHDITSEKKLIETRAWAENDPEGLLDFAGSSKYVATEVYLLEAKPVSVPASARESMSEGSMGGLGAGTEPAGHDVA
jgi:hypothetical protein